VLSRGTIYQYIKDGVFPKPVPLGPRVVGWLESDVSEWIAARVKIARRRPAGGVTTRMHGCRSNCTDRAAAPGNGPRDRRGH